MRRTAEAAAAPAESAPLLESAAAEAAGKRRNSRNRAPAEQREQECQITPAKSATAIVPDKPRQRADDPPVMARRETGRASRSRPPTNSARLTG